MRIYLPFEKDNNVRRDRMSESAFALEPVGTLERGSAWRARENQKQNEVEHRREAGFCVIRDTMLTIFTAIRQLQFGACIRVLEYGGHQLAFLNLLCI